MFPGDQHFYQFQLSAQEPTQHPLFIGAERTLFFQRVAGVGQYEVWAANNSVTDEAYFVYPVGTEVTSAGEDYTANRALSYCYQTGDESLSEIDNFNFLCASPINKPTASWTCDPTEIWFVMGSFAGTVTLYGETNLEVITRRRYGETFNRTIQGPVVALGSNTIEKWLKRWTLLLGDPLSSGLLALTMFGKSSTMGDAVQLFTKQI